VSRWYYAFRSAGTFIMNNKFSSVISTNYVSFREILKIPLRGGGAICPLMSQAENGTGGVG